MKRLLAWLVAVTMAASLGTGIFSTAYAAEEGEIVFEEIYDSTMNANNHNKNMVFSYFSAGSRNIAAVGSHYAIRRWASGQTCYFIYDALKKPADESLYAVQNKSFEVYTIQQSGHVDDVVIDYTTEAMPASLDNESISKLNWVKAEYTAGEAEVIPETASEAAPYYTVKYTSTQPLPEEALYIRVHFTVSATWGAMYEGIRLVSEGAADDPIGQPRSWASDAVVTANTTEDSAEISWPEISAGETGISYRITMNGIVLGDTDKTTLQINDLTAGTEYAVSIEAYKRGKVISAAPLNGTFRTLGELTVFRDVFSADRKTTWKDNMASYEGNPLDANNPINQSGKLYVLWRRADLASQNASGQTITYTTEKINSLLQTNYTEMLSFQADFVRHTSSGNMADVGVSYSMDGASFIPFSDFQVADGGFVSDTGEYSYNSITGTLPQGAVALRITVAQANRRYYLSYGGISIDMATTNYGYVWSDDAALNVSEITADSARLTWSAAAPAEGNTLQAEYMVYVNDVLVGTTADTSYSLSNLTRNAKQSVELVARAKEDSTVISKKLTADEFRTDRKRGTASTPEIQANSFAVAGGVDSVVSAKAVVSLSDISALEKGGFVTVGFRQSNGEWGNAYARVYSGYTEYYKNNRLVSTLLHTPIRANQEFIIDTDDCRLPESGQTFQATGAELKSATLYTTAADAVNYYQADNVIVTPEQSQNICLSDFAAAPLENLSRSFTFEADITLPETASKTMAIYFYSSVPYQDGKAKLLNLWEEKRFSHGVYGSFLAGYENAHEVSDQLYESRTWLPRIEYDGTTHNLKLFVDLEEKNIQVAIDDKIVSDIVSLSNWNAADLDSMLFEGDYRLNNIKVRAGWQGFAYYPAAVVNETGEKVSDLASVSNAKLRLRVLNTEAERDLQLLAEQEDAAATDYAVVGNGKIPAAADWQTIEVPVDIHTTNGRVKGFVWNSAKGMIPLTQSTGYIGTPKAANTDKRLFLIGDSTVHYVSNDKVGWGEALAPFLKDNIAIYNYGKDGTSSKTYWQSGRLNAMKAYMREGDYLIVQLAHNDRHADMEKGTTIEEYKGYLRKYVAEARQLGLNVLFVTPPTVQGDVGKTEEALQAGAVRSLYFYVQAMKEVAEEQGVPLVDLYMRTINDLPNHGVSSSGNNEVYWTGDGTHFTQQGAELLCGYLKELLNADAMKQQTDLGSYFKE